MEEQLIEFETAKLARKQGFNIEGLFSYKQPVVRIRGIEKLEFREYSIHENNLYNSCYEITYPNEDYYAPTQSLLQKWLREVHNIIVFINPGIDLFGFVVIYNNGKNRTSDNDFKTWEEALEKGLLQGLKLIK